MKKSILASTIALALLANSALAHSPKSAVETVTIYGSATNAQAATGAAQYIGEEELAKFVYNDIQRVLRQIPGVSVQGASRRRLWLASKHQYSWCVNRAQWQDHLT